MNRRKLYKKSCKKLREIERLHLCTFKTPTSWAVMSEQGDADCAFSMCNGVKCLSSLSHEEEEKLKKEDAYRDQVTRMRKKTINDLPEDIEFIIMSYLPPNLRLVLLKQKYSYKFLANKLHSMPKEHSTLQRLHSLVGQCKGILKKYLDKSGDIYKNVVWYIDARRKDIVKTLPKHCEFLYYEKLSYIIMAAIQNYTKMYKKTNDINEHFTVEKQILGLYVRVVNL